MKRRFRQIGDMFVFTVSIPLETVISNLSFMEVVEPRSAESRSSSVLLDLRCLVEAYCPFRTSGSSLQFTIRGERRCMDHIKTFFDFLRKFQKHIKRGMDWRSA